LGEDGAIARDIDFAYSKNAEATFSDRGLVGYLMIMNTGRRMGFNKRTHRRENQAYTRLQYTYLCARMIDNYSEQDLTEEILFHLSNAFPAQERIWGAVEWSAFTNAQATIQQFDPVRREALMAHFGNDWWEAHQGLKAGEFSAEDAAAVEAFLGHFLLNEIYRQLLLRAITDEWVEYLTKMEALRIQVSMESYGQRNPLLAYKSQATDLFRQLLSDIRMRVISSMFTTRPHREQVASVERQVPGPAEEPPADDADAPQTKSSGRRRHKRR
jgi:preprotein translocase subunit SecA